MYKLIKNPLTLNTEVVCRIEDGASIPICIDNTDYQAFKKDILEGAELLDADGQVMQDAIQFVKELA